MAYLRFEWSRIFTGKRNLAFFALITLLAAYFTASGAGEIRRFQAERDLFNHFEKEKFGQIATYAQYGGFGFRILYEAGPLNLFFVNSSVLQHLESNVDSFEVIRADSSFKGDKLFLMRGFFKDFAGILFVFGSLLMFHFGRMALVSAPYLRFVGRRISVARHFVLTSAARLAWLDLFFFVLGMGLFALIQAAGIAFSAPERRIFCLYLLFLLLFLDFIYVLGQFTTLLAGLRKTSFLWVFLAWFACIFLLPELNRISVFRESQALEPAEKVNLEKFRNLMSIERKFRDYLKANSGTSLDELRRMQKEFAMQFLSSSFWVNTSLEIRYLRQVERVIAGHENRSLLFPTTYYQYLCGEISGKGYHGYLAVMDYVMKIRSRFMQFFLQKRYLEPGSPVMSFITGDENIFRAPSRLPGSFRLGTAFTGLYGLLLFLLSLWGLRRRALTS